MRLAVVREKLKHHVTPQLSLGEKPIYHYFQLNIFERRLLFETLTKGEHMARDPNRGTKQIDFMLMVGDAMLSVGISK